MTDLLHIPLADIAPDAFPRDRGHLDPAALDELVTSIATTGLRQPIEVCAIEGALPYALISGFRRLTAFQRLAPADPRFATIPAFLRRPDTVTEALRLMVEENAVRADISPWDQGRIAVEAVRQGLFDTLDAAVEGLYRSAHRNKRLRLRSVAMVVECLDGALAAPETLRQSQILRVAASFHSGFAELMLDALRDSSQRAPKGQWKILESILTEAEKEALGELPDDDRPGYPRRRVRARRGLTIRRELARDGWVLRFTGVEATGALMEEVMDYVEAQFGRKE